MSNAEILFVKINTTSSISSQLTGSKNGIEEADTKKVLRTKDQQVVTMPKQRSFSIIKTVVNTIQNVAGELQPEKMYKGVIKEINAFEPAISSLSNEALREKTNYFKNKIEEIKQSGKTEAQALDFILPETFAVAREASKRILEKRDFEVQLLGGVILHSGKITEMKTGEGKTLTAVAPAYLNAITGKGVHVVTVNDYLADRDAKEMKRVFEFLGLLVGVVLENMSEEEKKDAYNKDITYVTDKELVFDYLRDNIATHPDQIMQREPNYIIVDEIDQILIDENSTPLIIAMKMENADEDTPVWLGMAKVANHLTGQKVPDLKGLKREELNLDADYRCDPKGNIWITPKGWKKLERLIPYLMFDQNHQNQKIDLSDEEAQDGFYFYIENSLKARELFKSGIDYTICENKEGKKEIAIIESFNGRIGEGKKWTKGIHEAVTAKEIVNGTNMEIPAPTTTAASITYPNFLKRYPKISGMSGTAKSAEAEFQALYKLPVLQVSTNMPYKRNDFPDIVFKTKEEKNMAVIKKIEECHENGMPVLVFTPTVKENKELSNLLAKLNIEHQTLNCENIKQSSEYEASVIAKAGVTYMKEGKIKGTITIATDMAGRGTDIKPDANAINQGGLFVLCTEHHESVRTDDQARGRTARQGDPGDTQFIVSLEDSFYEKHGIDIISDIKKRYSSENYKFGEPLPLTKGEIKTLKHVQENVEANNYKQRETTNKYDEALNIRRDYIYKIRREILTGNNHADIFNSFLGFVIDEIIHNFPIGYLRSELQEKIISASKNEDPCNGFENLLNYVSKKFSAYKNETNKFKEEFNNISSINDLEDKRKKAADLFNKFRYYLLYDFSKSNCNSYLESIIKQESKSVTLSYDKFEIAGALHQGVNTKEISNIILADKIIDGLKTSHLLPNDGSLNIQAIIADFKPKSFSKEDLSLAIKKAVFENYIAERNNKLEACKIEFLNVKNEILQKDGKEAAKKFYDKNQFYLKDGSIERMAILQAIDKYWAQYLESANDGKDYAPLWGYFGEYEDFPIDKYRETVSTEYFALEKKIAKEVIKTYLMKKQFFKKMF